MTFLVLVVGLLILRFHGHVRSLHKDDWFRAWSAKLEQARGLPHDGVRVLLTVLLPVAALALLLWLLRDWGLVSFVIALVVLLYSLGRGDLEDELATYRQAVRRGDTQAAYHGVTPINRGDSEASNWLELQQELVAGLPYRLFEREFAVVFWFAVLGPAGALLYRLAWLRAVAITTPTAVPGVSGSEWPVSRLLALLEWLPARLLIPSMAVVGNFTPVMQLAGRLFLGSYPAPTLLALLVETALGWRSEDLEGRNGRDVVADIQALMRRALVLWVLLVAVWVLFI